MKTTILIALALSAGTVFAGAQTNSTSAGAAASTNAPSARMLPATATVAPTSAETLGKSVEPSAVKRTDVVEGRNHDYGGVIPRVIGPERRNPLQLLNPFAPVTERERRFTQRPLPHASTDVRTVEPVGIVLISVEKK